MTRAADASPTSGTWTLVYDHGCGVCRVIAAGVLVADRNRRLVPLALGDARAAQALGSIDPARWDRSWHLVTPGGRVHSAGGAVPVLCGLLPGFGVLGGLCRAAPDVTERVYAWLVRHRAGIGRRIPRRLVARATIALAERSGRA